MNSYCVYTRRNVLIYQANSIHDAIACALENDARVAGCWSRADANLLDQYNVR